MSMTITTTKNNETTVLVTGATGTVGSEVVSSLHHHSHLLQVAELEQLFIRKIRLTNSRMKTKQLRLLIWIIKNQKLLLML